jgi:peptidoglycan lytic transglycosylase G
VIQTSESLRHLKTPYNSYEHTGLPPTPIDSPGALALKAALHPAAGSWRYFVTVNLRTGDTRFATTFQQHLHNQQLYIEYCQTSKAC